MARWKEVKATFFSEADSPSLAQLGQRILSRCACAHRVTPARTRLLLCSCVSIHFSVCLCSFPSDLTWDILFQWLEEGKNSLITNTQGTCGNSERSGTYSCPRLFWVATLQRNPIIGAYLEAFDGYACYTHPQDYWQKNKHWCAVDYYTSSTSFSKGYVLLKSVLSTWGTLAGCSSQADVLSCVQENCPRCIA